MDKWLSRLGNIYTIGIMIAGLTAYIIEKYYMIAVLVIVILGILLLHQMIKSTRILHKYTTTEYKKFLHEVSDRLLKNKYEYIQTIDSEVRGRELSYEKEDRMFKKILKEYNSFLKDITGYDFSLNIKILESHDNNGHEYIAKTRARFLSMDEEKREVQRSSDECFFVKIVKGDSKVFQLQAAYKSAEEYIQNQSKLNDNSVISSKIKEYIDVHLSNIKEYYNKADEASIYRLIRRYQSKFKNEDAFYSKGEELLQKGIEKCIMENEDLLSDNIDGKLLAFHLNNFINKKNENINLKTISARIKSYESQLKSPANCLHKKIDQEKYKEAIDKSISDYLKNQREFYQKIDLDSLVYHVKSLIADKTVCYRKNSIYDFVLSNEKHCWISNNLRNDIETKKVICTNVNYDSFYKSLAICLIHPFIENPRKGEAKGFLIIDSMEKNVFIKEEIQDLLIYMACELNDIMNHLIKHEENEVVANASIDNSKNESEDAVNMIPFE